MSDEATTTPCGRDGCGSRLLCCRPDCPLVLVDIELGLKRLYGRAEFVAAIRDEAEIARQVRAENVCWWSGGSPATPLAAPDTYVLTTRLPELKWRKVPDGELFHIGGGDFVRIPEADDLLADLPFVKIDPAAEGS